MTNYELIHNIPKQGLAVILAQIDAGPNDYPMVVETWYDWLGREAHSYDKSMTTIEEVMEIAGEYDLEDENVRGKRSKIFDVVTEDGQIIHIDLNNEE